MGDKPTYLGLLNAVAQAEWFAHEYLTDWIAMTDDPDVKKVLGTVAAREGEHGMAFAKRVNELGYDVLTRKPDKFAVKSATIARSDRPDLKKLEALGYGKEMDAAAPDIFDGFFADHTIDPATGALLGRYVCEERDSLRLLRGLCASLKARA
jgi:hypothetical protein